MVSFTASAKEQIDKYFAANSPSPIRIFLAGGCGGPRLALALDEPRDSDEVVQADGYTVIVEKDLYQKAAPMTVDMSPMGFTVATAMEMPSKGDGCGCSGCSCG